MSDNAEVNKHVIVLFGATGDLARLKLLPSFERINREHKLPYSVDVVAVGRKAFSTAEFVEYLKNQPSNPATIDPDIANLDYLQLDFQSPGGFDGLWEKLSTYRADTKFLFYMAVSPDVLKRSLTIMCAEVCKPWFATHDVRMICEKPFGDDLAEAVELNQFLMQILPENRILRNDHYLHKDTVKGLTRIMSEDPQLGPLLESEDAAAVNFVASETVDLGTRASYFDGRGMIVDWVQSHMLQVLASLCAPQNKLEFISSLHVIPGSLKRAQYIGYMDAEDVPDNSQTETFISVSLKSDLSKWNSTEFKLIAGKALAEKKVFIELNFKGQRREFGTQAMLGIDPPGGHIFLKELTPDYYISVIRAGFAGATSEFVSQAEVEAQWKLTEEIQELANDTNLETYTKGSSYQALV